MDNEGCLTITTCNAQLGDHEVGEADAGDYVRIDVTDDGCGMETAILDRVFEPFFTTKPVGKGTGLGLSQLFGFARQSGGDVSICSASGEGTTVSLFLPRFIALAGAQAGSRERLSEVADNVPAGAEGAVILVVEDDVRVRVSTVGALEELGYAPIACASAEEAIDALATNADIRLIITDVVMPGMTGPDLIQQIGPIYPHIGVLFVTGYVGEAGDAERFAGYEVLRKPFTVNALSRSVANAMGSGPRSATRAA
jgi:CheY-like chemotaxis protein